MESIYNFLEQHSYYVVLIITLIIWAGIFGYLVSLDESIKHLQNSSSKKHYLILTDLGIGRSVIFFIFPVIGIIMGIVWFNKYPVKAKKAFAISGTAVLIGILIRFISPTAK